MISTYTYKGYQAKFEVEPEEETILSLLPMHPKFTI